MKPCEPDDVRDGFALLRLVTRFTKLRIGRPRVHKRTCADNQTAGGVGDQRSQAAGVLTNTGEQLEAAGARCACEVPGSGDKQAASGEQCAGETAAAGEQVAG